MVNDVDDVTVQIDPLPVDDAVITLDPIEVAPIAIAEPMPFDVVDFVTFDSGSDTPPDAQTFGGPVADAPADDGAADGAAQDGSTGDSASGDAGAADGSSGDGVIAVDDGLVFTTMYQDGTPVDGSPVEGSSDAGPTDDGATGDVPADDTTGDPGSDVVIGRPVDPEPNWRTFDGVGSSSEDGTDGTVVLDKDAGSDTDPGASDGSDAGTDAVTDTGTDSGADGQPDVIYTLDPSDPLIYATTGVLDGPVRSSDPLPFERGNAAPAVDPAAPETHSDVVHYAVSEPFHTGLDLL